jgi:glucarate dehydratase
MRIKEMKLHPIAIADPPLRSSYGRHAPFALRTIVELVSTDGLTGISETYGGDGPLAGLEAAREQIVGSDPFQLTRLFQNVTNGTAKGSGDRTQTYLVPGENPLDQASSGSDWQGRRQAGLRCDRRTRAR